MPSTPPPRWGRPSARRLLTRDGHWLPGQRHVSLLFSQVPRGRLKDSLCGGHLTEAPGGDGPSFGNNQQSVGADCCVAPTSRWAQAGKWQGVRGLVLPSRSSQLS